MTVRTIAFEVKALRNVRRRDEDLIAKARKIVDKVKDSSKVEYLKGQGRPTRKVMDSPKDSLEDLEERGRRHFTTL